MACCEKTTRLIEGMDATFVGLVLVHDGTEPVLVAIVDMGRDDWQVVVDGLTFCPWCGAPLDVESLMREPDIRHFGRGDWRPDRQSSG